MTNNQIQYQRHLEDQRSNRMHELLTASDLNERARHNQATEQFSWADLGERSRHNRNTEQFSWSDLAERSNYHQASIGIERDKLEELHRSNFANEIAKYLEFYNGAGIVAHPDFRDYVIHRGENLYQDYLDLKDPVADIFDEQVQRPLEQVGYDWSELKEQLGGDWDYILNYHSPQGMWNGIPIMNSLDNAWRVLMERVFGAEGAMYD